MKAQRGFTLIELVVVIIVLGILAVTAAPKFIDLQSDARAATLQGAKGALQGANGMVYAKAAINGVEDKDCSASIEGCKTVNADIGIHPAYGSVKAAKADIEQVVELNDTEWTIAVEDSKAYITPKGKTHDKGMDGTNDAKSKACQLIYTPATDSDAASYVVVKGDC